MTNRLSTALRRHRARTFALAMLVLVAAALVLSPIDTASADTSSTDAPATESPTMTTGPTDPTAPATTSLGTPTTTTVAPTNEHGIADAEQANVASSPCPGSSSCSDTTDRTDTPLTASLDLAIHTTDGGAQPIGGVAGSDAFTYTVTVDNEGPSDASADATVTDVMPAGIDFVSYGSLSSGVSCAPPDGRTLECTIAEELLAVLSPAVVITVDVTVPGTTPGGEVTNKVIVDNPDDPSPCTVTATDITCDPSDTDNYSEVTTPIIQIEPDAITPITPITPITAITPTTPTPPPVQVQVQVKGASLAFTGSGGGPLAWPGVAMMGFGSLLVVATRRRRPGVD